MFILTSFNEPVGVITEEGKDYCFDLYETKREAQLEIIDIQEEYFLQFKAGEREFDECFPEDYTVEPVIKNDDGSITLHGQRWIITKAGDITCENQ